MLSFKASRYWILNVVLLTKIAMENKENKESVRNILENLQNVHYSAGVIHQIVERCKAQMCMKKNELEAIYHLVESHVPGLRMKTVLRHEKVLNLISDTNQLTLGKNHVATNCRNSEINDNINMMLAKIKEMPSEWTLVQLTPQCRITENVEIDMNKHYTNSLYLTVFNCGENQPKPFCVPVEAPRDSITGLSVPLMAKIHSIIQDNKNILESSRLQKYFQGVSEKENYYCRRESIDNQLKTLVKDLQDLYLKEWKCFMMGKYVDQKLTQKITKLILDFFNTEAPSYNSDEKTHVILKYLIKSAHFLRLGELRKAIQTLFPGDSNKSLQKLAVQFVRNVSEELKLSEQKRHPLILILDDSLDCFPWEMMEVLNNVSVSRLPSIHIAYALFQEHKNLIKNGFKIIKNYENGTYIVNPDLDLKRMQNRILSFYEYWLPTWRGIAGCKPSEEQFSEMLSSGDIFVYNGHGGGSHFFPLQKIEKLRINAVALLFGCSSTKLNKLSPHTEMHSTYQMYLIACSPCIVGNLWEVTDLDTDVLATDFLSYWVPNFSKVHWKHLDKTKWNRGDKVDFQSDNIESLPNNQYHEPELLKALSIAKKSKLLRFYITRAGIVARGIPVKIITK